MTEPLSAAQLTERLSISPFIAFMNLEVLSVDASKGRVEMRMPMRPEFERLKESDQFHGGAIAALIDTVGDYALIAQLGSGVPTINFSVDFLRPAKGPALTALAIIRRAGRSVGVVDVDVSDASGALVAIGRGCYSTQTRN
jgi:uncharacterized protein (TIGR00369 family)